jgi:suppressor of ftsI
VSLLAGTVLAAAIALPALHEAIPHQGIHDSLSGVAAAQGEHGSGHGAGSSQGQGGGGDDSKFRRKGAQCPDPDREAPVINDSFPEPPMRKSKGGILDVDLRASTSPAQINGQTYVTPNYNGMVPGPTLVFCRRDLLRVNLTNDLVESDFEGEHAGDTNIHTHGFHVSPRRPSDNIFVIRHPGQSFQYEYKLPADHPPGALWYHPHVHGQTNIQAYGGMGGAMIMRGGLDVQRGYRNIGTRVLVIQQTTLNEDGTTEQPGPQGPFEPEGPNGEKPVFLVNGEVNPRIPINPGELQRWRIYNLTAGAFVNLQMQGQSFHLLATDGNNIPHRNKQKNLIVAPASRREVLVRGPSDGEKKFMTLPFKQFGPGSAGARQTLATLDSSGRRVNDPNPPRELNAQQPDLRHRPVGSKHKIVYTQDPPNFFINGEQFTGPQDVMETLDKDEVSKWTIQNKTPFWHTFHIHINDFQVTKRGNVGGPQNPVHSIRKDDNLSVPPGKEITMRYLPAKYTGKFVFHCHVLGHEDNGMMGVVQVKK